MEWHETLLWEQLLEQVQRSDRPGTEKVIEEISEIIKTRYNEFDHAQTDLINKHVSSTLSRVKRINEHDKIYRYEPVISKLILLTQYYISGNEIRDKEITECIKKNIENKYIDTVCLFVTEDNIESCKKLFGESNKIKCIQIQNRLTYKTVFEYVYETQPKDAGFLLCNTDCYFDDTVRTLKHLKASGDIIFPLTRWEETSKGLVPGLDPMAETWTVEQFSNPTSIKQSKRKLEPWSIDAFYFKFDVLNRISSKINKYDIQLGINLCELAIQYTMHQQGITMHNIGFGGHVKCIHKHQSNIRRHDNWQNQPEDLIPGIFPCHIYHRTNFNSISDCYRLRGESNWLDQDDYKHNYNTDYVVLDITPYIDTTNENVETTAEQLEMIDQNDMCVVMLGTAAEIDDGSMFRCLDNYFENTKSKYQFDLYICLDTDIDEKFVEKINKYVERDNVTKVEITSANIPDEDNIYHRPWIHPEKPDKVPRLGLSNGPNMLFYETIKHLEKTKYKYILMIETDTVPTSSEWFDVCYNYAVESPKNWVITSSKYKGKDTNNLESWHSSYLNGVAIYRNNSEFHQLMKKSEAFVEHIVKTNHFEQFINYDVAHDHYVRTYEPWHANRLKDCDFIVNMSPETDSDADIEQVLQQYPNCVILHNKQKFITQGE
jgi:hypothetical protein